MLVSRAKIEVPDECPGDCRYRGKPFYQASLCARCPVFNCGTTRGGFRLMEPEDYREDWAREWAKFFATGKLPALKLVCPREKPEGGRGWVKIGEEQQNDQ